MALFYTLKIYTYWGVIDLCHISALQKTGVPCLREAPVLLSAFIHQADSFFAIADLMSPFLLPQLLNFFLQNVGYILTITTQILLSPLLLPCGLFGEREAISHKLLSHFPLGTYFPIISETSALLIGHHPTRSHP